MMFNGKIPIEDLFNDMLGKAMRGRGVTPSAAAEKTGISEAKIEALLEGEFDETGVKALAEQFGLHAATLVESGRGTWYPKPCEMDGLLGFNTPYPGMTVNAYLVWDPGSKEAAVFDTGTDASVLLGAIEEHALNVNRIFLTHTHRDHIMDLDNLCLALPGIPVHVGRKEPVVGALPVDEGDLFQVGGLKIEARLTSGHSVGGITYVVTGLSQPVAVVGDALFAGSMGGGMVSWSEALENNREKLFTLPDETVVCPGHGPATTIGEEKAHNPCYPEYK
jgi:hydroxyacylglutathione hydrolase